MEEVEDAQEEAEDEADEADEGRRQNNVKDKGEREAGTRTKRVFSLPYLMDWSLGCSVTWLRGC